MKGFNNLDLYRKSNILKEQANYLLEIEVDNYGVKLYAWDRFFIEQHFDEEQQVTKIDIVENSDMQKYLKKITLGDLGYPTVV